MKQDYPHYRPVGARKGLVWASWLAAIFWLGATFGIWYVLL